MKAMIFAAGLGTRLKPLTDTTPKALIPLAGKTMLEWQLDILRKVGVRKVMVNVHHFPDQIIQFVRAHEDFGFDLQVSDERDALLDTGGGLKKALLQYGCSDEPVLVCNVDILSNINLQRLISRYAQTEESQLVVTQRDTQRYLCFDDKQLLCGWTNVATGELKHQDGQHLAFSGLQILSPTAQQQLVKYPEDKFSLIDFYLSACSTIPFHAYIPTDYRVMDVGKIDQLAQAEAFAQSLLK